MEVGERERSKEREEHYLLVKHQGENTVLFLVQGVSGLHCLAHQRQTQRNNNLRKTQGGKHPWKVLNVHSNNCFR